MSGDVYVDGQKADKPGSSYDHEASIEVRGNVCPYVSRGGLKLEKALRDSDLGASPRRNGAQILLTMPELTEDRRKEYVKLAKTKAEDGKVAVRNIRRDAMEQFKKLEKDSKITEDDRKSAEKKMQDKTDDAIKAIDALCAQKEKEIMAV